MSQASQVLEYKCPCCNAGLKFASDVQKLKCEYCDNTFEPEVVFAYNESQTPKQDFFQWDRTDHHEWSEEEQEGIRAFQCPSCGGSVVTDNTTAATFCPFCDNPTILPSRLTGGWKPDAVLPFQCSKEMAQAAFLKLCKGKPLLPNAFTSEQRIDKITGMYVPVWLYHCCAEYNGTYKATRIRKWSDSRYHYTKTDHYLLRRCAKAEFDGIPMDGSVKMEDIFMESIEPFDYGKLEEFDTAYLTGYLADKYDVDAEKGMERIQQRVEQSMSDALQDTMLGYTTVVPANKQIDVRHSKAKYVLLPVWMLNTSYRGKIYTFLMNGQTGKMTGTLPICPKKALAWFSAIWLGVTTVATLLQFLLV